MSSSKEYLMLREEILHLDTVINSTINFFYVFVAAVLAFAITQDNSMFVLLTYVVIIPAYRIVLGKRKGIYKIASYLYVFHEGDEFNWERRQSKLYYIPHFFTFKALHSFNYPFLFVSTFVIIIFGMKTNWGNIGMTEEFVKVLFAVILYVIQLVLVIKNRIISIDQYIPDWERIKQEE